MCRDVRVMDIITSFGILSSSASLLEPGLVESRVGCVCFLFLIFNSRHTSLLKFKLVSLKKLS